MNSSTAPFADIIPEAQRIVGMAAQSRLLVRVLGGAGVALHDHRSVPLSLHRVYGDIDIVVPAKSTRATSRVLTLLGYVSNERFNALHGSRRMLFYDTTNGRQLDVFVGTFAMCHELDLGRRLDEHPQALDAADLLLTKLQIAEINQKDVIDAIRLLLSHEVAERSTFPTMAEGADALSLTRLREVTRGDWGWYTTFTDNLAHVRQATATLLEGDDADIVRTRIDAVQVALDEAPKSIRWRARGVIGRKTPWYQLPEEVDRGAAR